jgi:zinc protease
MLFQGSAHVQANEHFELIQGAGGTLNGSTWLDRTNYFEILPSNQLALALWLEADRMGALLPAMTQKKLDTQRDVVKNERRWSMDNQPYGTWWEKLPELAFPPGHPFHHSLMGSMAELDAASLDDIAEFFLTFYTPPNAVLTISGDFDPDEARMLVARHFESISRGRTKPPIGDLRVPERFGGWQHAVVEDDVVVPRLFLAMRSPVFGTDAYYAASVCAAVLGMRRGCRLHRALIREQEVASEATAFTYDLCQGSDLLVLDVTARPGVGAKRLEATVAQELDRLHADGVTEVEVSRTIALIETAFITSLQSAGDRADSLSQFATYFGNPFLLNTESARYRAVTAEQVSAFASKHLGENNRLSLLYVPRSKANVRIAQ